MITRNTVYHISHHKSSKNLTSSISSIEIQFEPDTISNFSRFAETIFTEDVVIGKNTVVQF